MACCRVPRRSRRRCSSSSGPSACRWGGGGGWGYRPGRATVGRRGGDGGRGGGAPSGPQVLEFVWAIGGRGREGDGQTENTAMGTSAPAGEVRRGKVGLPVEGCERRIADDGEILTRGPGTFLG